MYTNLLFNYSPCNLITVFNKMIFILIFLLTNINVMNGQISSHCHTNANVCFIIADYKPDSNHEGSIININCVKNISDIKRFNKIKYIDWNGCDSSLPGLGLEYIDYPNIVLELNITQFSDITLDENLLEKFTNLESLWFMDNTIKEIRGNIFRYGGKIKNLHIARNGLSSFKGSDYFGEKSALEKLIINEPYLEVTKNDFCYFKNLSNLKILSGSVIINSPICKNLTSLKFLRIENINIENEDLFFEYFKYASDLKEINIFQTNLTKIELIGVKLNLTKLQLTYNAIEQIAFNQSSFNILKSLNLSNNHISFINDDLFSGMPNLEELDLSSNRIQRISSHSFTNNNQLKLLTLTNNSLQSLTLEESNLKSLQKIYVDFNNWNCGDLEILNEHKSNIFKLFEYTQELKYVNVNGLKCKYSKIYSTAKPTDDTIIVKPSSSTDDSLGLITVALGFIIIIIIVFTLSKLVMFIYNRKKRSEFIPFYRRLTRCSKRESTATESTKSFMFRRKLPATQYETPINSDYHNEGQLMISGEDDVLINNNIYEEISGCVAVTSDDDVPADFQ